MIWRRLRNSSAPMRDPKILNEALKGEIEMDKLEYGMPKGGRWDEYLKNSKPPTREEILDYARKTESQFKLGRIIGWVNFVLGIVLLAVHNTNIRLLGIMAVLAGAMVICYIYLFGQICFASIQRMWERCENQEAELRKSIAEDL